MEYLKMSALGISEKGFYPLPPTHKFQRVCKCFLPTITPLIILLSANSNILRWSDRYYFP